MYFKCVGSHHCRRLPKGRFTEFPATVRSQKKDRRQSTARNMKRISQLHQKQTARDRSLHCKAFSFSIIPVTSLIIRLSFGLLPCFQEAKRVPQSSRGIINTNRANEPISETEVKYQNRDSNKTVCAQQIHTSEALRHSEIPL